MNSSSFDLIVEGGLCVTPQGPQLLDVGIRDGRIVRLGDLKNSAAAQRFSARGLHVLPGVIDSQVHFREPGLEHKENLATGTAAAALGGVTTVLEMPNTSPATTTREALQDKCKRAAGRVSTDIGFFIGASPENIAELAELERLPGCAGIKVFLGSSTGSLLIETAELLREVLHQGTRRVAIHAEDEARLRARRSIVEGPDSSVHLHPVWRDETTALLATQQAVQAAREAQRPIHVLHVTTAEEMEFLRAHRAIASVEVTPQHLFFSAPDCYDKLSTRAQMNPPLRAERHRQALWSALAKGTVDVIGSDHAPHTLVEKAQPYPHSPSGMPGVQTLLPVLLHFVHQGKLSLTRLVQLIAERPAALYGLAHKGQIAVGRDADLVLVDLKRTHTLRDEEMRSACGWTPFHGETLTGVPVASFLRGQLSMSDGELVGPPRGQVLEFEAL